MIRKWSIGNLVLNLFVIVWGAFVRASGSGAGCGEHWPLCNGEITPKSPELETMIEFFHRATSGIALLSLLAFTVYILRKKNISQEIKKSSLYAMLFMIFEALIGAGLVLFGLVAKDDSVARAVVLCFHLINTFWLVYFLSRTVFFAVYEKHSFSKVQSWTWVLGFGFYLLLGVSGGITALGDTLYPLPVDEIDPLTLSPTLFILLELRIYHPIVAVLSSVMMIFILWRQDRVGKFQFWRKAATGMIFMNLLLGVFNYLLKAPVSIQLVHLLFAQLIWIFWSFSFFHFHAKELNS